MRKRSPLHAHAAMNGGIGVQTRMSGSHAGTVCALNIHLSAVENARRTKIGCLLFCAQQCHFLNTNGNVVNIYSGYSLHLSNKELMVFLLIM